MDIVARQNKPSLTPALDARFCAVFKALLFPQPVKRDQFGRIQLQLGYDDYDGTLNVVVLSARGLQAKDKNGYSDPFARVQLLPGRM